MKPRFPLVAAVVSALLVGGATTGTTYASWADSAALPGDSITTGSMGFTATTPAGVTVAKTVGATADTSFVVNDTSQGKNLTQQITATVTGTPAGITATVGTSCGSGGPSAFVDTTPGSGNQTFCVRVTSSPTAVSGTVTLSLSGAQLPTGWTTPSITRNIAVTVNPPAPTAPTLTCQGRSGTKVSFTWTIVAGLTYTVHEATTNADASYSIGSAPSGSGSHTVTPAVGSDTFYRVKASNAGGTSGFSNTVRVVRPGSPGTILCTQVTP